MDHGQYGALLRGELSDDDARDLLAPVGFADWRAARRALQRLADGPLAQGALARALSHLLAALAGAAGPDRALVNLERLARAAGRAELFRYLADHPRAVEILTTLSAGSQFLTEILLRNPEYFTRLVEHNHLAHPKSVEQFCAEIESLGLATRPFLEQMDALRRFQRWELLRIGACDLLDLFDLAAATTQLSNLADALTRAALTFAAAQTGARAEGFVVLGLGKLGGRELNYSSDVDLLFLAAPRAEEFRRLGERLIEALTRVTAEGFLYRVDMRLRPWGTTGPLVSSLDGYLNYLAKHARLWEKQAMLKARVVAGDAAVGEEFLRRAAPLIYSTTDAPPRFCDGTWSRYEPGDVRGAVRAMKQLTEEHLRRQGRDWGEVKLGEGSIRDVEFVVQYLQLARGAARPEIRSGNTLDALGRLVAYKLLPADDHRALLDGYVFLRTVEHHLQMMHYQQTHTLPTEPEALAFLARRLGFRTETAAEQLVARYEQHRAAIRAVYLRYLGDDEMNDPIRPDHPPTEPVMEHLARMDASYAQFFTEREIQRHAALAGQLDNRSPDGRLAVVDAVPLDERRWRVTIVGYDYPGELSLICGLLFAYGFNIQDGQVFTHEPLSSSARAGKGKIVDVFTVQPVRGVVTPETWARYADELNDLLRLMEAGERRAARGKVAERAAAALREAGAPAPALYPVDIEIDNTASEHYTVLRIDAPDTVGFLYEFTNALAYHRVYVARVIIASAGNRVRDTLYVTDAQGRKITDPLRQRELRAAVALIKHFTHLLPHSPDPGAALLRFREFIAQLFRRPDWPDELASLERHDVLDGLARLLGVGEFLWEDFLRMQYANLFPIVQDPAALKTAKSRAQLQAELEDALRPVHDGPQPPSPDAPWRAALNAFKDREMFRIDMRHILGHTAEFWEFSEELTDLTEVVVNSAYHLCHEDLRSVYGTPCLEDGEVSEMAVCALGKCGGRELGFASDIELMFIYAGNGATTGPQVITTAEFYERLTQTFIGAVRGKREGIFEIDLQLRPYGKAGSMAVSLEAFRRYFAPDGPAWPYERQALVKLRPIAGNAGLGQAVAALSEQFVYAGAPFDVTAMRAMRERQIRHLVVGGAFNAKYSPGGLLDLEYLVQGLQITHGHRDPALRTPNTRQAMAALAEAGVLSPEDYTRLRKAHTFLRWLIDGLRMVRGNAKDLTVPPPQSEEFAFLARRLRYGNDVARLREELTDYTSSVREINARLLERVGE